jgi:hypothetical protein
MVATQVKNAVGEKCGNYVGGHIGRPEPSETCGQFPVLVEIAQVQNDLSSVSTLDRRQYLSLDRSYIGDKSSVKDVKSVL